jgi:ribosomal protein S18 acetylase RimI-like enzyme
MVYAHILRAMLESRASIKVRSGKPGDATAIAGVFRDSWQQAYRGIIPHAHLEHMIRRRGPDWWRSAVRAGDTVLILECEKDVVGYATLGTSRTRGPFQGEIYELYMMPTHQGVGLGEYLFEAARAGLDSRGLNGLLVWALSDNQVATDFYWRRGGRPIAKTIERFGDSKLEKIAFAWG